MCVVFEDCGILLRLEFWTLLVNARGEVSRCINLTLGASASRDVESMIHGSAIVPFSLFFNVMQ